MTLSTSFLWFSWSGFDDEEPWRLDVEWVLSREKTDGLKGARYLLPRPDIGVKGFSDDSMGEVMCHRT